MQGGTRIARTLKWGATRRLHNRLPLQFFQDLDRLTDRFGGERQEVLTALVQVHGKEDMQAEAAVARMELHRVQRQHRHDLLEQAKERDRLLAQQRAITRKLGRYAKLAAIARGRKSLEEMQRYIRTCEGLQEQSREIEEALADLAMARPEALHGMARSSVSQGQVVG